MVIIVSPLAAKCAIIYLKNKLQDLEAEKFEDIPNEMLIMRFIERYIH